MARRQLVALGLGGKAIDHRLASGRLRPMFRGVYAVGHRALGTWSRPMAAVLACGPDAVLSHLHAAAAWAIQSTARATIDVTVAARGRRGYPGIEIHRVRSLHPNDRTVIDGIPVTSLARTLLDLAEVVPARRLTRAIEEAERLKVFDLNAVDELIARSRGRRGLKPLRHALETYREPPPFTRSELERRFTELCQAAGLLLPSQNVHLHGYEVDVLWEQRNLVVELDGYEYHRTRAAFEEDRRRAAVLERAGYRVLRFSWRQVDREPALVEETIRAALRA